MEAGTFYISTVFTAGILSFFSPCILPLLPVYFSVFTTGETGEHTAGTRKNLFLKSLLFVAGLSLNFVILGFGAGILGSIIVTRPFMIGMGAVVVVLGLHQTGLVQIRPLMREKKLKLKHSPKGNALGVFLLGFTFSFGWTPCIGPILGAILGLAATGDQPLYGMMMMAIFSLGFLIPFLVLAFFSELLLKKVRLLNKHLGKIKIAGGVMIIIMGLFLMTDKLNLITTIFT